MIERGVQLPPPINNTQHALFNTFLMLSKHPSAIGYRAHKAILIIQSKY
jgi:hypothetical protein